MVVEGLCGHAPLPLIQVPNKVKANANYYIKEVFDQYLEVEVPKLYPGGLAKVIFLYDKASSHTANKPPCI